jgi:hypothetical protein
MMVKEMKHSHNPQPLYQYIARRRTNNERTDRENKLIEKIKKSTEKGNIDNISRTVLYENYFKRNPEIKWALLASMVSRNAGWNMTDLVGRWYSSILSKRYSDLLFLTYERANWLIFDDACPQLLLYEASKQQGKAMFYLLKFFDVSIYMETEWEKFWLDQDKDRLCTSLIINEQNMIQKPVIEQPFYKKKVFKSVPFRIQDWFHFNTVIFPTEEGEIYGFSVHDFRKLKERITLGRRLAWLLFHSKESRLFHAFSFKHVHTGSRFDYEKFMQTRNKRRNTPFLRAVYPVIRHHRSYRKDWYSEELNLDSYYASLFVPKTYRITSWYTQKQKQLHAAVLLEELLFPKKKARKS